MALGLVRAEAAEMDGLISSDGRECGDDVSRIGKFHLAVVARSESRKAHSAALVMRNKFAAGGQQWQPHVVTRPCCS